MCSVPYLGWGVPSESEVRLRPAGVGLAGGAGCCCLLTRAAGLVPRGDVMEKLKNFSITRRHKNEYRSVLPCCPLLGPGVSLSARSTVGGWSHVHPLCFEPAISDVRQLLPTPLEPLFPDWRVLPDPKRCGALLPPEVV